MDSRVTVVDLARAAEFTLLPPGGAWVSVKGNPFAPRGHRLPRAAEALGMRRLDVYYAVDEVPVVTTEVSRTVGTILREANRRLKHERKRDEVLDDAQHWYKDVVDKTYGHHQATLIRLVTPYSEAVCFYNGELAIYSEHLIEALLSEDCLEVHSFGFSQEHPVLEDVLADIVGALQVDGLARQAAMSELFAAGELSSAQRELPNWFYRPTGWYKQMLVEERVS